MAPYTEQQRAYWHSAFACGPPTGPTTLMSFTFTAGNTTNWYSRHGGQNIGTDVSGSRVVLGAGFSISRIWERGSATFQIQQIGGAFSDWVPLNPDATFEITTPHGTVTFVASAYKTVGGSFITWRPTVAQYVILLAVVVGDEVTVVISTP